MPGWSAGKPSPELGINDAIDAAVVDSDGGGGVPGFDPLGTGLPSSTIVPPQRGSAGMAQAFAPFIAEGFPVLGCVVRPWSAPVILRSQRRFASAVQACPDISGDVGCDQTKACICPSSSTGISTAPGGCECSICRFRQAGAFGHDDHNQCHAIGRAPFQPQRPLILHASCRIVRPFECCHRCLHQR
jgi:hypothetical protein